MTDDKIWKLIKLILYCSVPPILLVLTITIMYGSVNSMTVTNNLLVVLFQQSVPIVICYGLIPCIFFKLLDKESLREIGLRANRRLWMNVIDILIATGFLFYLAAKGAFYNDARIWVIHYLCVAVFEEILVRGIILYELKRLFQRKWVAVFISAVIFSLVFHSTDGIFINMLYRIPFGLITGILCEKTESVSSSILFHWIYDVLLSI